MRVHWILIVLVVAILLWIVVRRMLAWIRFSWRMTCCLVLIVAIAATVFYLQHESSTAIQLPTPTYQSQSDGADYVR